MSAISGAELGNVFHLNELQQHINIKRDLIWRYGRPANETSAEISGQRVSIPIFDQFRHVPIFAMYAR